MVWHRYPDRSAWALRKALAALHSVAPEQVWCANGSNEVLQTLLLAYGGAGRSVAVWEPTYALHRHIAELTATAVVAGRRGADLTLDRSEIRRVIDTEQPTVTFLCSPNNPTGEIVDPAVVADVLGACSRARRRRRGVRPVRPVVRRRPRLRRPRAGRDPHLLEDVVVGRPPTGLLPRAIVGGDRPRAGVAALPPRQLHPARRAPRPRARGGDGTAGGDDQGGARSACSRRWPSFPSMSGRRTPTSSSSGPGCGPVTRCGVASSTGRSSSATAAAGST